MEPPSTLNPPGTLRLGPAQVLEDREEGVGV